MSPDGHGKKRSLCASMEFKIIPLQVGGLSKSSLLLRSIGLVVGVAAAVPAMTPLLENISLVLPPLRPVLDKISTFIKVASKFVEVMAPSLDHHNVLTLASPGPSVH